MYPTKIAIKIDPAAYMGMVRFVFLIKGSVDRDYRNTEVLCVAEFAAKITQANVEIWALRDRSRAYCFKMPFSVAAATHQLLMLERLDFAQQDFLNALNSALTNVGYFDKADLIL